MDFDVRAVTDSFDLLGEGPVWDAERRILTWVDIYGRRVHALDPASGHRRSWTMPDRLSCAIPRLGGGMIVALARALAFFDPETGAVTEIASLDADHRHRFNDAKCDPSGRLWIGSMNEEDGSPTGALYRFDGTRLAVIESGVAISNSLAWSGDGRTLYFADTPERVIRAYDTDPATGAIGNRRALIHVDGAQAMPDGSATDVEGGIWNAQWDGGRVVRYRADGTLDRIVPIPTGRPTSVCFGGPDLTTLFVTSSCAGLDQARLRAEPQAGMVFAVETGISGVPVASFAG